MRNIIVNEAKLNTEFKEMREERKEKRDVFGSSFVSFYFISYIHVFLLNKIY